MESVKPSLPMQMVVVSRTRDKFLVFTNRIIISYFICIHPTFISCDSSAGHGSFHSELGDNGVNLYVRVFLFLEFCFIC